MKAEESDQLDVIRPPLGRRIASIFATVLIGAIGILMLSATVLSLAGGNVGFSIFFAALAGVMGVLFRYMLRDTRGKGWCITIGADALGLDLPRGRCLIHRLDPVHGRVRFDEIETVETRLEAYPSFGMVNMHRAYALKLKTGRLIILGEDRALNTGYASSILANTVERIVRRAEVGARDLGMAEGRGGILSVLFTSPPPWDAPSLSNERQAALWRAAGMTGGLAESAVFVTLLNTHK